MFHKIKSVNALSNYKLSIQFSEGKTKIYDINPLFDKYKYFNKLKEDLDLFNSVYVDKGGYAVVWDDNIDISCEELWNNGEVVITPFDGLMSFGEASEIWNLNESTLRKAVSYGKLINGVDVCKFGKQWVISIDAMKREYGNPINSIND